MAGDKAGSWVQGLLHHGADHKGWGERPHGAVLQALPEGPPRQAGGTGGPQSFHLPPPGGLVEQRQAG